MDTAKSEISCPKCKSPKAVTKSSDFRYLCSDCDHAWDYPVQENPGTKFSVPMVFASMKNKQANILAEKALNSARRDGLPSRDFAVKGRRYPIDTAGRARSALSRVAANGTPAEKSSVRHSVHRQFSNIKIRGLESKPESLVTMALNSVSGKSLTASQVVTESKKIKTTLTRLNESSGNKSPIGAFEEPLQKTYVRYIKSGNTYAPAGDVKLAEVLAPCPYHIKMTMAGPVFERVKTNTDEIIKFKDSRLDKIIQEIDKFWNSGPRYKQLGLMQNRGLLLAGKAGVGKSICLQQVSEMMASRGDVVFFADSPGSIRAGLEAFREIEPERPVVMCFEEVEELFRHNERDMLRILDGDAKINKVLWLGTTNYAERLSPRCKRPGRFDSIVQVPYPSTSQRLEYLKQKLNGVDTDINIARLAEKTSGFGFGHLREVVAGIYAVGHGEDDLIKDMRQRIAQDDQS